MKSEKSVSSNLNFQPRCFFSTFRLSLFILYLSLFTLHFSLFTSTTFAETLPIKTYTSADGLVYEGVRRVYQDSRGFVWFCTPVGVSRFDGYQFTSYAMEDGLSNPGIVDVVEDESGIYWLGTSGTGVYKYDPRSFSTQKFVPYKIAEDAAANDVRRFHKSGKGEIFVATAGGVFLLNEGKNEQKFSRVELKVPLKGDETLDVLTIAEDANGSLWFGHQFGLTRRRADGATIHYQIEPNETTDTVRSLAFDNQNRLWIVADARNLIVFNPEPAGAINPADAAQKNLREAGEDFFAGELKQGFAYRFKPEQTVGSGDYNLVRPAADGAVWLATRSKGLIKFEQGKFRQYTRANGLSDDRIAWLLEDTFGNLWIASSWGAMRLSKKGFTTFNRADGLADDSIFQTFQAANGKIYAVNQRWIINEFDGEKFTSAVPNLSADVKWNYGRTMIDRQGDWWFGTNRGVYRFNAVERIEQLKTAQPKAIYNHASGLSSDNILSIFEDSRGDVWISFRSEAKTHLTRWERSTEKFHTYSEAENYPPDCETVLLREDASGNIFALCYQEKAVAFVGGKFTALHAPGIKKGDFMHDLLIDQQGRVWLGATLSGLFKVENPLAANPNYTMVTTAEGLSSNHIQYLAEDKFGRIYFVTSRGMDRLDVATGKIKYYTLADGLAAAGTGTAFRAADGNLWLGTSRGLSKFVPEAERTNQTPQVFIGGLRVAGKDVPLALGETEVSGLTLAADERQMQIDFYGLSLGAGEALRYQYKLEGAENEWSAPTVQRTANYPNIAPGDYRFLVRAVAADGSVGASPAIVSFTVQRPVWQRWWFLLLAALIISFLIYLLYRYRVAQLLKLERVRTRLATDLHDDIGSSLSQIAILSEVVRQKIGADNGAGVPLDLIADTSREMVDSMSDIVWAINPQKDHLSDLAQRMRRFASDVLDAQDIAYRFHFDEQTRDIALGADVRREVYLIFKESVNNLIKHAAATEVKMSLHVENNSLIIRVSDNGKGFVVSETAELISAKDYDGFGGNGLANMRRRAENLGGQFEIDSGENIGTNVTIKIPLK